MPAAEPAANYELVCAAADTRDSSVFHCLRSDTRTGDVRHVDLSKLPISNGPTASSAGPPGTYQLVCGATSTETRSDVRCVRLHRQTGDLLLVNLSKLRPWPE